jgi:hypothetical protein
VVVNTPGCECYIRACLKVQRHEDMENDRAWVVSAQFNKKASATWMIEACFCKVMSRLANKLPIRDTIIRVLITAFRFPCCHLF